MVVVMVFPSCGGAWRVVARADMSIAYSGKAAAIAEEIKKKLAEK